MKNRLRNSSIRVRAVAVAVLAAMAIAGSTVLAFDAAALPAANAFLTDTASHPPPTTGGQAYYDTYGTFGPNQPGFPGKGQSYTDPVFGSTINRLTNEVGRQSWSDIYSKNGYFNADNTLMVHNTPTGRQFINPQTGAVVRASVPGNDNSSFDPLDPDVWWWYTFGGTTLNKYSVSTGTSTVVKTFAEPLGNNGGSIDWIDRTGRYMVLHLGSSWRMYDVKADILYANPIPDTYGNDPGYTGLTPDGNYIITTKNANPNAHRSWKVDHTARSVSTNGVIFWTLCGDHGDFVSASNGKSYWVVFECDSVSAVYAVDVSLPQSHTDRAKQLADNKQLMKISWSDSGHFSRVSRGPLQDWAFGSIESGDDAFGASLNSWRAYKQEIVMVNVLSGEVRRLAHHRSRDVFSNYYYMPRVSASWDGGVVAWASNMGLNSPGYVDIYSIRLDPGAGRGSESGGGGSTAPAPVTAAFSNPASGATVSGTATVTVSASGGSGTGYSYTAKAGASTIYSGTNPSFSWNTATTPNGAVTLSATVTDSAGATGSASRTATVANTVVTPLAAVITSPAGGATVSGTVPVTMSATGGTGTKTYTLQAGSSTLYSGAATSYTWNTTSVANGSVTLTLTVTDGAGTTATTTRAVTVSNTIAPPPTGGGTPTVVTENVVWTSPVRVAVSGNALAKNAGCDGCWDAGAASQQTIAAGDGAVQFTASSAYLSVGLSTGNPGTTASEIAFALQMSPGYVEVRESGVYRADWRAAAGAVYKIAVEGGKVKYYENGLLKYTSTATPAYPLLVDSTIGTVGAAIQGAVLTYTTASSGATTPPAESTPPPMDTTTPPPAGSPQPVVWINGVRVAVADNTITKSAGCNGCGDAGAVSQQAITSGNGSVAFKASANAYLSIGLSNYSKNTQANEIKFALRFSPGVVEVRELGAYKTEWRYTPGAVYTVAVETGQVKYYENGILKYTSTATPTYPLIVDSTLGTIGAGVQNATLTK